MQRCGVVIRVKTLEPESLTQIPGLPLITCIILNKLFKLTKPQFPHL